MSHVKYVLGKKEIVEQIESDWEDNEEHMGEFAALEVACATNGKTSEWYFDNCHLSSNTRSKQCSQK